MKPEERRYYYHELHEWKEALIGERDAASFASSVQPMQLPHEESASVSALVLPSSTIRRLSLNPPSHCCEQVLCRGYRPVDKFLLSDDFSSDGVELGSGEHEVDILNDWDNHPPECSLKFSFCDELSRREFQEVSRTESAEASAKCAASCC